MIEIDARRLLCPMPVIRTQDAIKSLEIGDKLRITCTDPGVQEDIPTWCRINGHTVLSLTEENAEFIITIEVGD